MVGRPVIWGLATAGSEGVHGVLAALNAELIRAMTLCQIVIVRESRVT